MTFTIDTHITEGITSALDNDFNQSSDDVEINIMCISDTDEDSVCHALFEIETQDGSLFWAIIWDQCGDQEVVTFDGYEITDDWGDVSAMWEHLGHSL